MREKAMNLYDKHETLKKECEEMLPFFEKTSPDDPFTMANLTKIKHAALKDLAKRFVKVHVDEKVDEIRQKAKEGNWYYLVNERSDMARNDEFSPVYTQSGFLQVVFKLLLNRGLKKNSEMESFVSEMTDIRDSTRYDDDSRKPKVPICGSFWLTW